MVGKGVAGCRGRIHSAYNGEGGEIVIWPVISYYTEYRKHPGMEHCTLGDAFTGERVIGKLFCAKIFVTHLFSSYSMLI